MLSKTTRLCRREEGVQLEEPEESASYLETVRDRLEAILEQLLAQKKVGEQRWQEERQALQEELMAREAKVEKLEVRVRQLQRENQQMRYQYGQRVSLMGILKEQNSLLSRQHAQDKQRMKETIDLLLAHNTALQQALSTPHLRQLPHPKPLLFSKSHQFYSMTDLRKLQNAKAPPSRHPAHRRKKPVPSESQEEPSFVRDLEGSVGEFSEEGKVERDWEFQQSRITEVKGRGQLLGLDRMSAVTQQSRQRLRH